MPDSSAPRDRKAEHLRLAVEDRMQGRHAFDDHVFVHEALPEIALEDVDTSTTFLGKSLRAPLLVSCMTGGTPAARSLNRSMAAASESLGLAFGLGSMRRVLEDPSLAPTYQVRDVAPGVPLLANLGAVQLNEGYGVDHCRRAVDLVEADALVLHLNPLQEALQPEGQTNFRGLLAKIGEVVASLEVPVIVKEVGSGISEATARRLTEVGVRWIDTAGAGGTSWARIEGTRAGDDARGARFADWGLPTDESIRQVRRIEGISIVGSGGVRDGLDAAKVLALGADMVGLAQPALRAAFDGEPAVRRALQQIVDDLRLAMFCTGASTLARLRERGVVRRSG